MPARASLPAQRNRGQFAWEVVSHEISPSVWIPTRHPQVSQVVTRSQVHAVTDDTNKVYLKAVFKALDAIVDGVHAGRWPAPQNLTDLDGILSAIVDDFIYKQRLPPSVGKQLHAAWAHVYPNHMDHLSQFSRSVAGWQRLIPGGERFGLSLPRWGAIARGLQEAAKSLLDREAALWWKVFTAFR